MDFSIAGGPYSGGGDKDLAEAAPGKSMLGLDVKHATGFGVIFKYYNSKLCSLVVIITKVQDSNEF